MTSKFTELMLPIALVLMALLPASGALAQNATPISCAGSPGPSGGNDSHIESVTLVGENGTAIDYTWNYPAPAPTGVEDQTSQVVELAAGQSYTAGFNLWSRSFSQFTSNGVIWIDFNGDGVLTADERVHDTPPGATTFVSGGGVAGTLPTGGVFSSTVFTVPANAPLGPVIMRVLQNETSLALNDPCQSFTWGAMVDFTVEILEALPAEPELAITPAFGAVIDFGAGESGDQLDQEVTVENTGTGDLELDCSLSDDAGGVFALLPSDPLSISLSAGADPESFQLRCTLPSIPGGASASFSGELSCTTNDANLPGANTIGLLCQAEAEPAPALPVPALSRWSLVTLMLVLLALAGLALRSMRSQP